MYWLRKKLHTESAVDAANTYRYKLPTTGNYTAFEIRADATRYGNRAGTTALPWLGENLTKVEFIVEGTKVVKSLRGRELFALNAYDFGRFPGHQHEETSGRSNFLCMFLLAGTRVRDQRFWFPMDRLPDPEIAITNDITEDSTGYWTADSLTYDIYGWRMMGGTPGNWQGYFRADERIYYTTTATSAEKLVDIAAGKPIRRIMVMGHTSDNTPYSHFTKLELEVNDGEYSPDYFDSMLELAEQNAIEYGGPWRSTLRPFVYGNTASIYVESLLGYPRNVSATGYSSVGERSVSVKEYDTGRLTLTGEYAAEVLCETTGFAPLASVLLGYDAEPDLANMLHLTSRDKIRLKITEAAASKVVSVVVEELITG